MKSRFCVLALFVLCAGPALYGASEANHKASYDHYLKGLLAEKQGDLSKAREEYEAGVKAEPESAYLHKALAEACLRMSRVDEAAEEIEKAIALNPLDHDTRILAGEIYFDKGDRAAARANLEKALEINPQSEDALLNLAYLSAQKEPRQAVDYYKKYLEIHPDSPQISERLALLYQQLGQNESAENAWQEVLSKSADSVKAELSLGQIYEVKGDTQAALGYYENARQATPGNLPLLLHLGQLYFRLHRSTDAASAFLEAEKAAPDNLAVNFWLALTSENQRDWKQAASHMDRVSRVLQEPGILLRLSYYYAQAGDMSGSLDALQRLRALDPSEPDYIYYQAVGEETAGHLKAAIKLLNEFLAVQPKDAEAHFELGTVLDRAGHFDEAVPHFQEAIRLKPDFDAALNYLGYSWADKGVHLNEAEALITRALKVSPTDGSYRDSLGWVYYKEGRFADAVRELTTAAAALSEPLIQEHLGDAFFALGKKPEAYQAWEKALSGNNENRAVRKKIRSVSADIPGAERARLSLKRAQEAWDGLKGFSGLARVSVEKQGSPEARFAVQVDYRQGELFKVEPVGGAGFIALDKGKWTNALVGAQGLDDDFRDVAVRIDAFLSGRLLNGLLKDPALASAAGDDTATASAKGVRADLEIDPARVTQVFWAGEASPSKGAALDCDYRSRETPDFPSRLSYADSASGLKVKIDFDRILIEESGKPH